ncbi:MAG: hypothetical protein M1832_005932 [Thelocarpon impressellum]|nr:MAG: hypothetical protein M1832_005932 [Thelocarpon impressellum]
MFNFTPLLGAHSASAASQSLLELDGGVKILVDVGWHEDFDPETLRELERQVPTVSIILLTHATTAHLAAFAHCCKHFPLFTRIPIYATTPVISLGRTLLQDLYASTPLASTFIPTASLSETAYSYTTSLASGDGSDILLPPPTSEEIATYFSLIHPLKYSQTHQPLGSPFSPPLNGLSITAYSAGHTLGGTIWHIQHGLESIVYAVDWNHARENVLSGAAWTGGAGAGGAEVIEQLRKPTALVCSSRGAERVALPGGRKRRDELLLDMIRSAVARGGTVLIPTDSSARVLELAYLLEHAWRSDTPDSPTGGALRKAKLYLASKNIGATMRYARSMLEWMDEAVVREFEAEGSGNAQPQQARTNGYPRAGKGGPPDQGQGQSKSAGPFEFRHLKLLERKQQVDRIIRQHAAEEHPTGQVILASDTSLEWGFSREVFRRIATDGKSLIILTERSTAPDSLASDRPPALARLLWQWWEDRGDGVAMEPGSDGENLDQVYVAGKDLEVRDAHRVPLEGTENLAYQQYLATQRQLNNTLQPSDQAALASTADAVDDASSSSSSSTDDSDSERQGKALNISATLAHSNRNKADLSNADLGINVLLRRKGVYDFDVRGKKGREKMFPYVPKRRRADDFGDFIRPEEYLKAEEREEIDGQEMRATDKDGLRNTLGQKRKWDEVGRAEGGRGRPPVAGTNKRRQLDQVKPVGQDDPTGTGVGDGAGSDDSDVDAEQPVDLGPAKVAYTTEVVRANFRIAFVDFSGLHDKRSLQMLLPLIQPRKLILVSGTEDETLSLAADCRKVLSADGGPSGSNNTTDVFTPVVGRTVDASVDTNAWTLRLSESLVRRLLWQNVRGLGVVHVTGLLTVTPPADQQAEDEQSGIKKQKLIGDAPLISGGNGVIRTSDKTAHATPTLDVMPPNLLGATRSVAQSIHVGDLRLADLRKILQGSGHSAEFRGEGTLLVDGLVAVKKTSTGKIEVEGGGLTMADSLSMSRAFEGSFYAVKRKIYEGLAVVAGG